MEMAMAIIAMMELCMGLGVVAYWKEGRKELWGQMGEEAIDAGILQVPSWG